MKNIKIISNPYGKIISFNNQLEDGSWQIINENDNKLLQKRIVTGFFPFVVQEIVDIIKKQYGNDISLYFEGTDDDYNDLLSICTKNSIDLHRTSFSLRNAENILTDVKNIYEESKDLINSISYDDKDISDNINRFNEASSDIIPICVIGNYSSGKSTFINALIGRGILPCGDNPVTAQVYKINKSKYSKVASIEFNYLNDNIAIEFDAENINIKSNVETEFVDEIKRIINDNKNYIHLTFYKILESINKIKDIQDIEITVPFKNGILNDIDQKFIIYDTPGANSTTNFNHMEVLRNKLMNLSNGLLIFVTDFDSLDSKDNTELYKILKSIEQLDERFNMIVVNKADNMHLPENKEYNEKEIDDILHQSVPQNLYSNGIYYVSSIMGLGSKNEGKFIDEHNEEIYDDNCDKYSNSENKRYKQLYNYDIMPKQLKEKLLFDTENMTNKVYVNSGLFAIEHEIVNFITKYSSYNKCQQASAYLKTMIDQTGKAIDKRKEYVENQREKLSKELDYSIKELQQKLENRKTFYNTFYNDEYSNIIEKIKNRLTETKGIDFEKVKVYEDEIRTNNELKFNIEDIKKENKEKNDNKEKQLSESIKDFNERNGKDKLVATVNIAGSLVDQLVSIASDTYNETKINTQINKSVANDLFDKIQSIFCSSTEDIKEDIRNKIIEYFDKKVDDIKSLLITEIKGEKTLNDEQKEILSNAVVNYEKVDKPINVDDIIKNNELIKRFLFVYLGFDSKKAKECFNNGIEKFVTEFSSLISKKYKLNFQSWTNDLIDLVKDNISKFDKKCYEKSKEIEVETEKINKLNHNLTILSENYEKIEKLIDFQNIKE